MLDSCFPAETKQASRRRTLLGQLVNLPRASAHVPPSEIAGFTKALRETKPLIRPAISWGGYVAPGG